MYCRMFVNCNPLYVAEKLIFYELFIVCDYSYDLYSMDSLSFSDQPNTMTKIINSIFEKVISFTDQIKY